MRSRCSITRLGLFNRLVDDLHLLSLARAGQLVVERSRFNLANLIDERLSWMASRIESGAVRVTRELDPPLTVEADRERLGQVFIRITLPAGTSAAGTG
jgi:C4-dicarboxylate-specific signal transduction histidine kinase